MKSTANHPAVVGGRPRLRMLVIDDESPITAAISDYFATLGYRVDCAADEAAAHRLLDQADFEVVITDLHLSRADRVEGLDIVGRIRGRDSLTVCIVLTAYSESENEKEAYRRGADAFLHKPTPLPSIAAMIAALLKSRHGGW